MDRRLIPVHGSPFDPAPVALLTVAASGRAQRPVAGGELGIESQPVRIAQAQQLKRLNYFFGDQG